MLVKELIELLQKEDSNAEVFTNQEDYSCADITSVDKVRVKKNTCKGRNGHGPHNSYYATEEDPFAIVLN